MRSRTSVDKGDNAEDESCCVHENVLFSLRDTHLRQPVRIACGYPTRTYNKRDEYTVKSSIHNRTTQCSALDSKSRTQVCQLWRYRNATMARRPRWSQDIVQRVWSAMEEDRKCSSEVCKNIPSSQSVCIYE